MKETKYRFTINGKTYHGYGYAKTRCEAIISEYSGGFGYEITKAEVYREKGKRWEETENTPI